MGDAMHRRREGRSATGQWAAAAAGASRGWGRRAVAVLPLNAHAENPDLVFFLALGFLAGLAAVYYGATQWRVGQLVRNTATERVRSAAVGRTEIEGVCRDVGLTYDQPYTDGECVYRHWEVEEYRRSSGEDNSREWHTVDAGTDVAPFFVEDDTGRMLVDTTQAPNFEISDANSYSTTVGGGDEPPEEVQSFSPYADRSASERLEGTAAGWLMETALGSETTEQAFEMADSAETAEGEDGTDPEAARKQAIEQHVDDQVLDEDGRLREDVTAAELQQAIDEDMADFGPSDLFGGMAAGGGADATDGTDQNETGPSDDTEDGQAIVAELGGTGEAGDIGTEASLARRLVGATLGAATNGWLGSSSGGGGSLFGSRGSPRSSNRRRYSHEVLPVDEEVYVFGATEPRSGADGNRLKLGVDPATDQFIVSDRGERGIVTHYTHRGPLYVVGGVIVSTACLAGLLWTFGIA